MLENVVKGRKFLKMVLGSLRVKSVMMQGMFCLCLETLTLILEVKLLFLMLILMTMEKKRY